MDGLKSIGTNGNQEHLTDALEGLKSLRYQSFVDSKPWLNDEGEVIWSAARIKLAQLVFSQAFETTMGVVIVTNLILIMIEADRDALCYPEYAERFGECPDRSASSPWIFTLNLILLLTYSLECSVRFFVERSHYWYNTWNMIDLTTVVAGWLSNVLASVVNLNLLRLARLVRVIRAVRVFISIPEFYLLMTGLYSSIKAILFGSLMLISVILFWAVLAVELFNPIASRLDTFPRDCERCPRGFSNVAAAGLTFFQQIVAGDSWGTISVPLIEKAPWTGPILFLVIISISLGVMNLILAVIVERASEARDNDHEQKIKKKEAERDKSMVDLAILCANMDKNENGLVSLEEMKNGYEQLDSFRKLMKQMDIKKEEMQTVFNVLDHENSGEISYVDFCKNLGGFQKRDPVIMQSIVHCAVLEVRKLIRDEVLEAMYRHHEELLLGQNQLLAAAGLGPVNLDQNRHRVSLKGRSKQKAFAASRKSPPKENPELRREELAKSGALESLVQMEKELQPLLERADAIIASLAVTAMAGSNESTSIESIRVHTPPPDAEGHALLDTQDNMDLRFQKLCQGFQEQYQKAELMQERLHDVLESLAPFGRNEPPGLSETSSQEEFHRRMFYV